MLAIRQDTSPAMEEPGQTASALIDARIKAVDPWKGQVLGHVRALIHQAVPDVVEEWKWRGVPVWSAAGILCTGEVYKAVVKLTFFKGAALADPAGLFNASLEGNVRRAIDIPQGGALDPAAFTALVQAAAALNRSTGSKRKAARLRGGMRVEE